jgi:hypothetical protein
MKHLTVIVASLALAACGLSCSTKVTSSTTHTPDAAPVPSAPATTPAASSTAAASTAKPKADAPATPAAPAAAAGAGLTFTPPSDWVVEQPTSKMRVAQYKLPKFASDAEDAELVIYHFGAVGGGSVEANLERWCGQFAQPDGRKSSEVLTRSERKVNGMDVTEAKLTGTYVAETSPGSNERVNKPGFEMIAAIIKSSNGDYYAKLVGPSATVEHHSAAFTDFISRVK